MATHATTTTFNFTTIDFPNATWTTATGINNAGQIVGGYSSPSSPSFYASASRASCYLLSQGNFTTINGPGNTAVQSVGGINDACQIVASAPESFWGDGSGWLFDSSSSTYTWIPVPPGSLGTMGWVVDGIPQTATQAEGINNAGLIVGYAEHVGGNGNEGYILASFPGPSSSFTTFDCPGASSTSFYGINNAGQIVGAYLSGTLHGLLYEGGNLTTIDYPSAQQTTLCGINDAGQIVGYYTDASSNTHGFLYAGGSFIAIDYPGAVSTWACGINDAGQIVGYYTDASGNTHGYSTSFTYTGDIYIRADGSVDPWNAPVITSDNITYVLMANVSGTLTIERDNIVFDGAGYTFTGSGSGNGITLSGRSNVTVRNTRIINFVYGIYLASSSNCILSGNNVTNNGFGIMLYSYSNNNTLSGNNAFGNTYGIYLYYSSNNTLSGNKVTGNSYAGIYLYSSCNNNTLSGNSVANNYYGIYLNSICDNNVLSGNNITATSQSGIVIDSSSSNTLSDNNMANNGCGFELRFSSGNVLSGNNVTGNSVYGIVLSYSSGNTLSGNNVANYFDGIWLGLYSNNNLLSGNTVTANSYAGIGLESSSGNTVSSNNATNNQYGIFLSSSSGDTFFHNLFVNNVQQVRSDGNPNVWDNGYPSGGNYWSNYVGTDLCDGPFQNLPGSDGIGDTPYTIDGNNRDNYPWMTANYTAPYQITFDQTGVGADFGGSVITVDGADYNRSGVSFWWKAGSEHTFSYHFLLVASENVKRYACMSVSGLSNRQSDNLTIDGSGSVTGNYVVQWNVTFAQSGLDNTASSTIVTINGTAKIYGQLPNSTWIDSGDKIEYSYESIVDSSTANKQFRFDSVTGSASPITVASAVAITGNYVVQWNVTFMQIGVGTDFSSTVITVNLTDYDRAGYSAWTDDGSIYNFDFKSPLTVSAGKQYAFVSVNASSGFTVSAATTVTSTYKTQYWIVFRQDGVGVDFSGTVVTVNGTVHDRDGYSAWTDSGDVYNFTYSFPLLVTANVKQYAFAGANATSPFTVSASETITGTYKTQWYVTFTQSGLDGSATGTVVTVNSTAKGALDLPYNVWVNDSDVLMFNYGSIIGSSTVNKQFMLSSVNASSPLTVTGAQTVTGAYTVQYYVTFAQSGLDGTANGTVVTVNSSAITYSSLPHSLWVNSSDSLVFNYANVSSTASSTRFTVDGVNASSPLTVTGPATVMGNYVTQYCITFSVSGVGSDFSGNVMTVGGTGYDRSGHSDWYDNGSSISFAYLSPLNVNSGKRYVYASQNATSPLTVSMAETVTGNYTTQWYITVSSVHDLPTSSAWVDQGNNFTASVTSPADNNGAGTRYRCTGYTLDGGPPATNGSTSYGFGSVQSSHTITFNWIAQYCLTVNTSPAEVLTLNSSAVSGQGWYDSGTTATVNAAQDVEKVFNQSRYDFRRYFESWTGATPTGTGNQATVLVDGAKNATANYLLQYYVTQTVPKGTSTIVGNSTLGVSANVTTTTGSPTVTVANYTGNPAGPATFWALGKYVDVHLDDAAGVSGVEIRVYYTDADVVAVGLNESLLRLYWWNGTSWLGCSNTGVDTAANYIWAKIDQISTPNVGQLTGAIFGGGEPYPALTPMPVGGFVVTPNYLLVLLQLVGPWIIAVAASAAVIAVVLKKTGKPVHDDDAKL